MVFSSRSDSLKHRVFSLRWYNIQANQNDGYGGKRNYTSVGQACPRKKGHMDSCILAESIDYQFVFNGTDSGTTIKNLLQRLFASSLNIIIEHALV